MLRLEGHFPVGWIVAQQQKKIEQNQATGLVDLKDTVRQTQQNLGGTTPVEDEPHGLMARRNMSQHVKTGLNAMQGMPGNVIGNDFDDVIGIESPYALKLALTIGK